MAAEWRHVPPVIASLPLTKLCLHHMAFDWETLEQRLTGGFSREFTQLAPTLQVWALKRCCSRPIQKWQLESGCALLCIAANV